MNSLLFIALFVVAIPVFGAGIHFPSSAISESPDGRWKLYSFEHEYVFDLASGRFEKAMEEKPDKSKG